MTFLDFFTVNEGWVPHCPDFLWRLVALIHSMRLSLMKGAHADLSSTAWQEIGVKPGFGLSGIPQHLTRLFCHPACPGAAWERSREPALSEVEGDLQFPVPDAQRERPAPLLVAGLSPVKLWSLAEASALLTKWASADELLYRQV